MLSGQNNLRWWCIIIIKAGDASITFSLGDGRTTEEKYVWNRIGCRKMKHTCSKHDNCVVGSLRLWLLPADHTCNHVQLRFGGNARRAWTFPAKRWIMSLLSLSHRLSELGKLLRVYTRMFQFYVCYGPTTISISRRMTLWGGGGVELHSSVCVFNFFIFFPHWRFLTSVSGENTYTNKYCCVSFYFHQNWKHIVNLKRLLKQCFKNKFFSYW